MAEASGALQVNGVCRLCDGKFLQHQVVMINKSSGVCEHKYFGDCDSVMRRKNYMEKILSCILKYQGGSDADILERLKEYTETVGKYYGNSMPKKTRVLFRKKQLKVFEEWVEVNRKRAMAASEELKISQNMLKEAEENLAICRSKSEE